MDAMEQHAQAAGAGRVTDTPLAVIETWLAPLAGRRILDVGCGRGALARDLVARGARACGVDPLREAVMAARELVPEATFLEAGAQALPFAANSFDAAILLNSLHHVPPPLMAPALSAVLRVTAGPVLVIEPLAEGPFFEVMRPLEDETAVRHAAQAALARAVGDGHARVLRDYAFDDVRRFADLDGLLARVVGVDPARAAAAKSQRGAVAELMARWGTREGAQMRLDQPHRAVLLTRGDLP